MEKYFADKLISQIKQKKSIICVGLDPRIEEKNSIPSEILKKTRDEFENIDEANDQAIWLFNKALIDETHDITPVYKPQIAFYEKYNALNALKKTIDYIHEKNSLALLDAKRNDIGSTSMAYADNVFSHFNADAVTVNSYFGIDGVKPFFNFIPKGKGVILLLKTSNPSSHEFQDLFSVSLPGISNTTLEISLEQLPQEEIKLCRNYIQMSRLMKNWSESADLMGDDAINGEMGYSSVGGVVGATYPEQLSQIRKEIPRSFILIPGYGAQGGTAQDIINGVNNDGLGAIVNSSRAINFAYQSDKYSAKFDEIDFDKAAGQAALDMRNEINVALQDAGKIAY